MTKSKTKLNNWVPLVIFSAATLFYFYDFFLRVFPSAMTYNLMREFKIDAEGLGILSSLFFYGYMPMQIPAGLIFDRFGVRHVLIVAAAICTFSILIFAFSNNLYLAASMRFLMGVTTAFSYVGALVLIGMWFHRRYFSLMVGLVQFAGAIGAIVGAAPITMMVHQMGRTNTLIIAAAIGALMTFIFWLFIQDNYSHTKMKPEVLHHTSELKKLKIIFSKRQNLLNCIYGFGIWAPIEIFASMWGIPFFKVSYNIPTQSAAILVATVWIGIAIGGPVLGWWSAYLRKRRPPMILGAFLGILSSLAIVYLPLNYFMLQICLFLFGVAASAQAVSFGIVDDQNPLLVAGSAAGLQNMAIVTGGMVLVPLVGTWLKNHWQGFVVGGVPYYTQVEYESILWLLPACFLIAFLVSVFALKETHCQAQFQE